MSPKKKKKNKKAEKVVEEEDDLSNFDAASETMTMESPYPHEPPAEACGEQETSPHEKKTKRKRMPSEQDDPHIDTTIVMTHNQEWPSSPRPPLHQPLNLDELLKSLVAGVESNDTDMVLKVMEEKNEEIVEGVVEKLPYDHVLPLIRLVRKTLVKKSDVTSAQLFWLQKLIANKLSYLLSLETEGNDIRSILETLNFRIEVFDRVLRLKGRLNLLLSQVRITVSFVFSLTNLFLNFRLQDGNQLRCRTRKLPLNFKIPITSVKTMRRWKRNTTIKVKKIQIKATMMMTMIPWEMKTTMMMNLVNSLNCVNYIG